jgi:dethiobiotin synthetase
MTPRLVVVGTGTGVGKTFVAAELLRAARRAGERPLGLKPIETGLEGEGPSDAAVLASAAAHDRVPPRFAFGAPVSPHRAARDAGVAIEVAALARWVEGLEEDRCPSLVVVETAGGLLSPIARDRSNLDLALALDPVGVVVVAPDRLGALHEIASARAVLDPRGAWERASVVFSAAGTLDAASGTHVDEMAWLGWGTALAMPRGGGAAEADRLLQACLRRFTGNGASASSGDAEGRCT